MRDTETTVTPIHDDPFGAAPADAETIFSLLLRPLHDDAGRVGDFSVEECNDAAAHLLDAPRDSLCGSPLSEYLPAFLDEGMLRQLENVVRHSVPVFDQVPGGQIRPGLGPFRISATPAGGKLFLMLRPLTSVDPVEERFRLAAQATSDGFWDWRSSDGDLMWWSVGFYNLLGIGSSESPTRTAFFERIHADDRKRFLNALAQQTASHARISAELRVRAVHNEYRWFRIRAVGHFSDEGALLRVVGAISDIEELKQAELMLRSINEQLEQRVKERTRALRHSTQLLEEHNDYLKDFATFASHDLREPLRKIRAYGDLLVDEIDDSLNEDARDYLSRMLGAGERMQRLIDDLLVYSRSTGREAKIASIDLNELLAGVVSDLEVSIRESGASLDLGDLPVIHGTPSQFRQLFQNLLSNAVKYHQPEARPSVRVQSRDLELTLLPADPAAEPQTGRFHEICVQDNGIGFPQRFAERIFMPFKRLNNRNAFPGSGVGLALCRRVAERHGGFIYARSAQGQGTSIYLLLPAQPLQNSRTSARE